MIAIAFSTENIISLTRLEMTVRKEYGQRFNLSDTNSLLGLLKLAAESSIMAVKIAFYQFIEGLKEEDKQQLIYRGVAVDKEALSQQTAPAKTNTDDKLPEGVIKLVYRGKTIYKKNGVVITDPFANTETTTSAAEPENKATERVYRGQIIKD